MKRWLWSLALVVALAGGLCLPQLGAEQAPPIYSIEMDIRPVQQEKGTYACHLTVSQDGDVVAAPRLQLATGSEGQARSANPNTGEVVDLTVVSNANNEVTYQVEIRSGDGALLSEHKARVRI